MLKLGGLPNHVCKPCKPAPLGTMFRDAAECMTRTITHADPVMCPEQQAHKEFFYEKSDLPDDSVSFVTF